MQRLRYLPLLLAVILSAPFSAIAENSTTVGGFTVHYNAFTTSTLTPEVARAYGIRRSKNRGLLSVSVIEEKEGAIGTSVPGLVQVKTLTLTGQGVPLAMREIREVGAVYYIGEFRIQDREKVNFAIKVTPRGTSETFIVNMEHQFFTD